MIARRSLLRVAIVATASTWTISGSPADGRGRPIVVNASPEELVTRNVSYADLNLASPPGLRALQDRVDGAVGSLCTEVNGGRDQSFIFKLALARCTHAAWLQASPQIDLAVQRARDLASTGKSSIVAAALTISLDSGK